MSAKSPITSDIPIGNANENLCNTSSASDSVQETREQTASRLNNDASMAAPVSKTPCLDHLARNSMTSSKTIDRIEQLSTMYNDDSNVHILHENAHIQRWASEYSKSASLLVSKHEHRESESDVQFMTLVCGWLSIQIKDVANVWPKVITIHSFCDRWQEPGAAGMMKMLLGQLVGQAREKGIELAWGKAEERLQAAEVIDDLRKAFEELVGSLPKDVILYCIVDSIEMPLSRSIEEAMKCFHMLRDLTRLKEEESGTFKLFLTCHGVERKLIAQNDERNYVGEILECYVDISDRLVMREVRCKGQGGCGCMMELKDSD
ncbi:hypothetical protein N0V90_001997 [Kalmusia sp. IMI 367209]|nr:hypothetical protein N0V90_001997 [Kalmusia sp. IMI 367209]